MKSSTRGIKIEPDPGKSGFGKWGDACSHCGKLDRAHKDCRLLKNNVGAADTIEVINDALFLSVDSPLESWIFSTAAQFHCSPHKGIFEKYTAGNYGKAYFGMKNSSLDIVGRGDVRVKLPGGARWIIHNVMHIPGLVWNLISVGQLDKEGYDLQMSGGSWKVLKAGEFFSLMNLSLFRTSSRLLRPPEIRVYDHVSGFGFRVYNYMV